MWYLEDRSGFTEGVRSMKRREVMLLLGGAGAWTLAARSQQRAMPVVGYISGRTADSDASMLVAVRRGLADVGYADGRNVAIEYRFADGRYDRLSAHLTDLTQRKVGVIVLVGALTEGLFQQSAPRRSRSCSSLAPIWSALAS